MERLSSATRAMGALLVLSALSFTAPRAEAAVITNGSFESPNINATLTDNSAVYRYVRTATPATGWSMTGSEWAFYASDPSTGGWIASDGQQFMELESGYSGEIYTTLDTVAGTSYRVSFDYAANYFAYDAARRGFARTDDDAVAVLIDGVQVYFVDGVDSTLATLDWFTQSFEFTATSSATELRFRDISGGVANTGGLLDNVHIELVDAVPRPLPEPGTLWLVGAALLGLGRRTHASWWGQPRPRRTR